MKTTIDIPDALYRDVKAEAARRGKTVREVTTELYEAWLAGREPVARRSPDPVALEHYLRKLDDIAAIIDAAPDATPGASLVEQLRRDRDARG